jgi:hypothetical protein
VRTETRLGELHRRLREIPAKRARSRLVSTLGQYGGKVAEARQRLEGSALAERNASRVFPELPAGTATESRRKAARTAERLARVLRERIDAVSDAATEKDIVDLGTYARNAEQNVRDRWARRLEDTVRRYETLVGAAEAAGLERGRTLSDRLRDLRSHAAAPPSSAETADRLLRTVEGLVLLVGDLGLEGPAGVFLVDAARGAGDPRALRDPEVQAFVERHDLWRLLAVKFR